MNQREKNDLDRHITGNYGEDSVPDEPVGEKMDPKDEGFPFFDASNDQDGPTDKEIQAQCDKHNAPIIAAAESNVARIKSGTHVNRLAYMAEMEKEGKLDPSCPGCLLDYESIRETGMMAFNPHHQASTSCQSGGHNHCTCDTCF